MTPFVSVALIRRDGAPAFRRPRKERPDTATHARKAAARYWNRTLAEGDTPIKTVVLRERSGLIEISERRYGEREWTAFTSSVQDAIREPHLAACLAEIGITADFAQPAVPDVLIINGYTYRRDI